MILSIGEILADMIGQKVNGVTTFKAFCGGAPFNLAVNAKQSGAKVGFVGRVGNDVIGRFVLCEAQKAHLERLDIQIDAERNTTIAFVTLTDGERDFAFNRHDTADFNIDFDDIDFESYENFEIVHLGSLMLSEQKGREFAEKVANKASELGAKLSFDMNFRKDIYRDLSFMTYAPVLFISALTGQRTERIFELVNFVNDQSSMRITTGLLNDVLADAQARVQPPSDKGRRLKIYYMTQAGTKPPHFVIFCNDARLFHFSYQRYLENQIREVFGLQGTPIRITIRQKGDKEE